MVKGAAIDVSSDAVRSDRPGTSKTTLPPASSRVSVIASVVPMFRRHTDEVHKTPLLTLKLSKTTFLDTSVTDDITEQSLYTIKTIGPTTSIKRADPWDGDTKMAEIRWSRTVPDKGKNVSDGVLLHMRGLKWKGSETFLRRGGLSGGRKFNIPNYAHSLKWKRQGNAYWCTTAAVKGPIAILHPAVEYTTPQLQVFETLHDKNDARPMLVHHGVSTLLLDYLLVTALFLVTDLEEWTQVQGADIVIPIGNVPELPGLSTPKTAPGNFSTSNQQWRKIMYGEPMFPNRTPSPSARSSRSSISSEGLTPTPIPEQVAQVMSGHSLHPVRRSSSPAPSSTPSGSDNNDNEHMFFSPILRPHSPAAESIFSPVSRGGAPSHTYLDPSFYKRDDIPPVPPMPAYLSDSPDGYFSLRGRPSSSQSRASTITRRLPEVPIVPVPPLVPRPRSTPPRPRTSPSMTSLKESTSGPSVPRINTDPDATPRRPTRQLPRPPQTPMTPTAVQSPVALVVNRSRSHSQSHTAPDREKWRSTYGQRTLPSPPTSSSRPGTHGSPLQRVISEDGRLIAKEANDELEDWVAAAEPAATYDMPPPAYNSINFSPRVADSPLQGPTEPMG
ncbi:hypothetical protein H0H92_010755 [Tricholoma furcatifolium]|nr:hypothetical protein H0H92_010755 [Tricholoma furcatifolium]